MIYNTSFKIKRNKHACIHMFLGVKGSEGACISELRASLIDNRLIEHERNESFIKAKYREGNTPLQNRKAD